MANIERKVVLCPACGNLFTAPEPEPLVVVCPQCQQVVGQQAPVRPKLEERKKPDRAKIKSLIQKRSVRVGIVSILIAAAAIILFFVVKGEDAKRREAPVWISEIQKSEMGIPYYLGVLIDPYLSQEGRSTAENLLRMSEDRIKFAKKMLQELGYSYQEGMKIPKPFFGKIATPDDIEVRATLRPANLDSSGSGAYFRSILYEGSITNTGKYNAPKVKLILGFSSSFLLSVPEPEGATLSFANLKPGETRNFSNILNILGAVNPKNGQRFRTGEGDRADNFKDYEGKYQVFVEGS